MCNEEINRDFLKALPKCEHHMHLEGALTPAVLFKLAAKNNITLPSDDPAFASPETLRERYQNFTSLDDFLHYYYIGMSVLITASDFEALACDYFEHAAADGVVHAEVFFDPQAHLSRGVSYEVVLNGFNAARERAQREFGISSELICCFLRHLPAADCEATFNLEEVQASYKRGECDTWIPGDLVEGRGLQVPSSGLRVAQVRRCCESHSRGRDRPITYLIEKERYPDNVVHR